jgi:6-phosphofructokinase 1
LLCTRLGAKAGDLLREGHLNCMVALQGDRCCPVPLEEVAGVKKTVPPDHEWLQAARRVGTCLGDALS